MHMRCDLANMTQSAALTNDVATTPTGFIYLNTSPLTGPKSAFLTFDQESDFARSPNIGTPASRPVLPTYTWGLIIRVRNGQRSLLYQRAFMSRLRT